jgi:hypothetical protein
VPSLTFVGRKWFTRPKAVRQWDEAVRFQRTTSAFSLFQRLPQDVRSRRRLPWLEQEVESMIRTIWVGVAAILYSSTIATAQSASLPLEQQQPAGVFRELTLQDILDKDVTIVETSGPPGTPSVKRIERVRRDSVWNGVLIGAGAGALAGFGLGRSLDSPACPRPGIECGQGAMVGAVGGAFWGAIGGWITDALIRKRETVSPAQDGGRD